MLFRVGRTLAVVACASAAAIEFALAADIPYVRSPPPVDVPASWAGFSSATAGTACAGAIWVRPRISRR